MCSSYTWENLYSKTSFKLSEQFPSFWPTAYISVVLPAGLTLTVKALSESWSYIWKIPWHNYTVDVLWTVFSNTICSRESLLTNGLREWLQNWQGKLALLLLCTLNNTSSFIFYFLDQVQEELRRVVGSRQISVEDRKNLPYTDAVIHETQRIASILPLSLPHITSTDVTFQGYFIKKVSTRWIKTILQVHAKLWKTYF